MLQTRFVEKFKKMAILPHIFEQDGLVDRSILVFCKTNEQKEEAMNAGASLVGGTEIIRDVEVNFKLIFTLF
jgi:ribosomal protein L1